MSTLYLLTKIYNISEILIRTHHYEILMVRYNFLILYHTCSQISSSLGVKIRYSMRHSIIFNQNRLSCWLSLEFLTVSAVSFSISPIIISKNGLRGGVFALTVMFFSNWLGLYCCNVHPCNTPLLALLIPVEPPPSLLTRPLSLPFDPQSTTLILL